jgi:SAM-dependent methyltransferase
VQTPDQKIAAAAKAKANLVALIHAPHDRVLLERWHAMLEAGSGLLMTDSTRQPPSGYAPGWGAEVLSMLTARTANTRAGFVLPFLRDGVRVLDVGCGPGTITLGLAAAVAPSGAVVGVDMQASQIELARRAAREGAATNLGLLVAMADALPFEDASFDVVFAHALFEHLAAPATVLAEMRRVLRPGGLLGLASSDWSGARVEPFTPHVRRALEAHYALRRRAGGDPFAGGHLPGWVVEAGFGLVRTGAEDRIDMPYPELANYIAARIHAALQQPGERADRSVSREAEEAAIAWARSGAGTAAQRWVHVMARR